MTYGATIGKKFYEDGTVRRYPGNTVVADILPGNPAYEVMCHLRQMVIDMGLTSHIILLPADSYHMTVIRGVNDQVRSDTYWPAALPKDATMTEADDFVSKAYLEAGLPGPVRMRFDSISISKSACIIRLHPADEEQAKKLWDFRNRAAEKLGHRLPRHEEYRFHISLGYVWKIAEGADAERIEQLKQKVDAYIADQPEFWTAAPYMAYYDDMHAFSPERLPR